jgi:hypothetical protein
VITDIPVHATVDSFVRFVLQNILHPIDRYDDHEFLKYLHDFMLTHRMNKSEIFEGTATLASCRIADDDAYTIKGNVQEMRDLLAIPMGPLIRGVEIRVNPESPASGETYVVEVADGDADRANRSVVFVSVHGTDGYSVLHRAVVTREATAKINVRAAKAGTVDTIEACAVNDCVDYPRRESAEVVFRAGGLTR